MNTLCRLVVILLFIFVSSTTSASCTSEEYCPRGWQILRRPDQSAHTCDPMNYNVKCPKPHTCVHSKCGMSFCCANPEALRRWKKQQELHEEIEEVNSDL